MSAAGVPALALRRVAGETGPLWQVRAGERVGPLGVSLSELLRMPLGAARRRVEDAAAVASAALGDELVLAPLDAGHEVWAAGVTYARSRDGRIEEARDGTPYDRVYAAERPELFFKATGARVVGDGEPIGIRADSEWNAPEPELAVVANSRGEIFGYGVGDDVSSRSIEGENLLYLPQAKAYTASCALAPEIVPAWAAGDGPWPISLSVARAGTVAFTGETSTSELTRGPRELLDWLFAALEFPDGVVVLTGTGIVPGADFTLTVGDGVGIEIGGIGRLHNWVIEVGRRVPSRSERRW